ncbi:MAG: DUF4430 domain-containing protein [Lachnospiraceae bacterium]|nr:DUF4430 domain-containing protein [Lachnospiraceae bacterium]
MRSKFIALILACLMMAAAAGTQYSRADAVDDAKSVISGIVMFKMQECGASDTEEWIEKDLIPNAGATAETYAYALAKEGGYDLSGYTSALSAFLAENEVRAATTRLKYALCLTVADRSNPYIEATVNEAVGAQGIMSLVYGLHLYNNGYESASYPPEKIVSDIMALRHEDGGWSVIGEYSDVDVTAMVVQALAGYIAETSIEAGAGAAENSSIAEVQTAADEALELLSRKQNADGGYSGFGAANAESTAQVLIALSSLGIDCEEDTRFIKDGHTIFDGLKTYSLEDGTYSHIAGGDSNATATMQVFAAMEAYVTMKAGEGPYYVLKETAATVNGTQDAGEAKPTATEAPKPADSSKKVENAKNNSDTNNSDQTPILSNGAASYKTVAYIVIAGLFVFVCALLFIFKKRNYKNFVFAAIMALLAVVIVRSTNISTKEDYYKGEAHSDAEVIGTVTLTIRCDTIIGEASEFIPSDGTILKKTEFELREGESVYELLVEGIRGNGIHLENKKTSVGAHGAYYISGINHIYEYEYGELSGWMYYVNGEAPSVGCGDYILKDGDEVAWLYTREIGRDIEQ